MKILSSQLIDDLDTFMKRFGDIRSVDINGNKQPITKRIARPVVFSIVSCFLTFYYNIITSAFIDYIKDIVSIFVGLFLTVLVFAYDRFDFKHPSLSQNEDDTNADKRSSNIQKLQTIRMYNYAKKFIYAIEFNIITGTFLLGILVLPLDFPSLFNIDFSDYTIAKDIISINAFKIFVKLLLVFVIKAIALFLVLLIFYYTLYAVTHLEKYMNLKNNEND